MIPRLRIALAESIVEPATWMLAVSTTWRLDMSTASVLRCAMLSRTGLLIFRGSVFPEAIVEGVGEFFGVLEHSKFYCTVRDAVRAWRFLGGISLVTLRVSSGFIILGTHC